MLLIEFYFTEKKVVKSLCSYPNCGVRARADLYRLFVIQFIAIKKPLNI
jgi:hypothetical protein